MTVLISGSTGDYDDEEDDVGSLSVSATSFSPIVIGSTAANVIWSGSGIGGISVGAGGVLGSRKEEECNSESESDPSSLNARIPDAVSPILAARFWKLTPRGILVSSGMDYPWKPGPQRAQCNGRRSTPEHLESCTCGFYGLTSLWGLDGVSSYRPGDKQVVEGLIHLWGTVIEYEKGCRGEYAQLVALVEPSDRAKRKLVRKAAALYDVPLIGLAEFERRIPLVPL